MDFRSNRPAQQNSPAGEDLGGSRIPVPKPLKTKKNRTKLVKAAYISFLIAISVLILAMVLSIAFDKNKTVYGEKTYVKGDRYQAVFLNGGQVYFGKIKDLNSKYLSLGNIYYLRANQQVQPDQQNKSNNPNDLTFVKLGCELHGPEDVMVINREQVVFWENLKTDGKVAKAIEQMIQSKNDGTKCDQQQNSSDNSSSTNNNQSNTQNSNQNNSNSSNR